MTAARHNHKFTSPALKKEAQRRAWEERLTLTAYINELVKADVRRHPSKKKTDRS